IREALHPMADLATEPRWARVNGTFGEDAQLSARMTESYILGFQGEKIGTTSVACMTKHFSGGGPQKEGLDSHFEFHKGQVYPGNNFSYHLIPFEAAFRAHTAAIMPYYGIPVDQTEENVGFSYNKEIITGLLREKYKYDGVICTDWGLVTDTRMGPAIWPARAWGVESLSREERVLKIIQAGVDQFGGESCPEIVVQLVKEGKVSEARIDESVRRLLRQKFELGLFDNPYVDVEKALQTVGREDFRKAGEAAQRRAFTLLKNEAKTLPLATGKYKIYVKNVKPEVAARYGTVVDKPEDADFAIIRVNTPWYPVETQNPMARGFHHGDLDFKGQEKEDILTLLATVPTIVDIYLDRPAVIPEISAKCRGLLANYGASDEALLDVIFGKANPEGNLPFELPSSMEAVRNQKEDLPYDSKDPLYTFGFGLRY
ncbi:MAG: glycoside hydrolase family 3 protein, partial [Bacteroidetes bacterium]